MSIDGNQVAKLRRLSLRLTIFEAFLYFFTLFGEGCFDLCRTKTRVNMAFKPILLDIFFDRPDLPGFENLEGLSPRKNVQ